MVLDFVDGVVKTRNLPKAMVPSWQGDMPVSTQGEGSSGKERASTTEGDVEMSKFGQDEMQTPTKTTKKVDRLVLPIDVPIRSSQSRNGTSGGNPEAGGKRTRPIMPDKAEGRPSRQSKATKAVLSKKTHQIAMSSRRITVSVTKSPKEAGTVSLGEYKFKEFDEVTEDLVPGTVGKVGRSRDFSAPSSTDREGTPRFAGTVRGRLMKRPAFRCGC